MPSNLRLNHSRMNILTREIIPITIAGIGILNIFGFCDLDLDPTTFIYETDP